MDLEEGFLTESLSEIWHHYTEPCTSHSWSSYSLTCLLINISDIIVSWSVQFIQFVDKEIQDRGEKNNTRYWLSRRKCSDTNAVRAVVACLLNCCWSSPAQWFLIPSPTGPVNIFYSLSVRMWEYCIYAANHKCHHQSQNKISWHFNTLVDISYLCL
jgi:hypothetical protein